MYDRKVGDEVLSFGNEGVLYRRSFIMYDRQSESLWVHVSGEAIKGPRKGQRLKFLPSEVTTWNDWFTRHPMTSALVGEKVSGFMGTFSLRDRMNEFGLSIGQGREVSLLRFTMLKRVPVMQLTVAKQEVVAVFDPQAVRATAFSRRLGERLLNFETVLPETTKPTGDADETATVHAPAPLMRDSNTGSLWQRMTGHCIAGELVGEQLDAVSAVAWMGKRWKGFFPDGEIIGLPESGQ